MVNLVSKCLLRISVLRIWILRIWIFKICSRLISIWLALQRIVTYCNTLQQHHCNILLQHTATHCNTHLIPMWKELYRCLHCNTSQHDATHCARLNTATHYCNTLQYTTATHCIHLRSCTDGCTAPHYITLQHTTSHCNKLQHTATHCNTLQHIATHCNTLQHTATHCTTHPTPMWKELYRCLTHVARTLNSPARNFQKSAR